MYNSDGCSSSWVKELKFEWNSEPSNCNKLCGNGLIDTVEGVLEECDDQNTFSYDGCDSNWRKEAGFIWTRATPSSLDLCVENTYRPKAYINITSDNMLMITFNDTMLIKDLINKGFVCCERRSINKGIWRWTV